MSYVLAQIQLPIEISESGSYELLSDRTKITFEPCSELPEIQKVENQELLLQMLSIVNKTQQEETNDANFKSL